MNSSARQPTKALPFVVVLTYTEAGYPERVVKYRHKTLAAAQRTIKVIKTRGMLKTCPGTAVIES